VRFRELAIALVFLSVPAQALSKERLYSPVAKEGQEVRFSDGRGVLITGNGIGNLAVSYVPFDKKWGYVRIWAENASDQQFNISEGSLSVSAAGSPLRVMSYDDVVKAQKKKEAWAAFFTGLAAAANSYSASQAGYSNYSGSYSAHASSGGYSANAYGSYYGRSYNGGMAYLAQANAAAQNQAMFDRFSMSAQAAARDLQKRSLKANTLMPGQSVLGDIRFALPKGGDFQMRIDLAGRPIEVTFHEGPVVVDTTPRPVVNPTQAPLDRESYPAPAMGSPSQAQVMQAPPGMRPQISEMAKVNALGNPSGPAARKELLNLGCEQDFNLVSYVAGKAVFEASCRSGKRQLVECYGNGCRTMN
jgi:hypothetical protein